MRYTRRVLFILCVNRFPICFVNKKEARYYGTKKIFENIDTRKILFITIRNLYVKKLARSWIERNFFLFEFLSPEFLFFITTTRKHWNGKCLGIFLRLLLKPITMKKFAPIFLFFFKCQSWSLNSMGLKRDFSTYIHKLI